jgi:hypothetical protein
MKMKLVYKAVNTISIGELTYCKHSGRYSGVSIGRDKNGFFAATHRARSKSYPSPGKIPAKDLKWIKSTG